MAKQNHIFRKIRSGSQAELLAERLTRRQGQSDVRSISTIGALIASGMGLKVTCCECGHEVTLTEASLSDTCGQDTDLKDAHTPCASCGSEKVSRYPVSA